MKVQLKKSITAIRKEYVAEGGRSFSLNRDTLQETLEDQADNFSNLFETTELTHCCGILELGNINLGDCTKADIQVCLISGLLAHGYADTSTSPVSVGINYGLMFTIRTGTRSDCLFRDALLEILPFKLIGKGVNVNSGNELETYAIFDNTAE